MKKTVFFPLWIWFLAFPAFSLGTPSPTPTLSPTPDYLSVQKNLEDFIRGHMGAVKGLSVALVDGGKVVWVKGFGTSDASKNIPATGDTLYYVGGPSKLLTAVEVLKLWKKGKIGLDRPVAQYLRGFSIHSRFKPQKPITVRSLLANHSGLPGFFLKGLWVDQPESLEEFVKDLQSDYLVAPPQTFYKYSYVDYDLLGRIIELKTRKSFAQAMRRDVLGPLGMDSSSFELAAGLAPRLSKGYRDGHEMPQRHLRDIPAAGLVSSAADMAKFLQFVLGGEAPGDAPPLTPQTVSEMFQPQYTGLPLDFGHQVGWGWMLSGIRVEGSQGVAWHDGIYPPFISQVAVLPQEKLGVVFLANSVEAGDLADKVAVRALKLMFMAKTGLKISLEDPHVPMPKTLQIPRGVLQDYDGTYTVLGQLTHISPKDDHLSIELWGKNLDLLPVTWETFVPHATFIIFPIDLPQYPVSFFRVKDQQVGVIGGLSYPIPIEKITPVDIPGDWKDREGEYLLENPDGMADFNRIVLMEKDGFLTADMRVTVPTFGIQDRVYKVALLPVSGEDALVPGLFYGDGGTLHAVDDEEGTRVFYSGYWFKKKESPTPTPAASAPRAVPPTPTPRPVPAVAPAQNPAPAGGTPPLPPAQPLRSSGEKSGIPSP